MFSEVGVYLNFKIAIISSNRARQPAHHLSHDEPLVFGDSSSEDCSSHLAAVFMRLCESESVLDLLSVPFTSSVFVMRLTAPRWGVVLRGATASGLFPGLAIGSSGIGCGG